MHAWWAIVVHAFMHVLKGITTPKFTKVRIRNQNNKMMNTINHFFFYERSFMTTTSPALCCFSLGSIYAFPAAKVGILVWGLTQTGRKERTSIHLQRICLLKYIPIHPSIFSHSSTARLWGQQSEQRNPDSPLPGDFLQLIQWDLKALSGQPRGMTSPA